MKEHRCDGMPSRFSLRWGTSINWDAPGWEAFSNDGAPQENLGEITHCPWCPIKLLTPEGKWGEKYN